MHETIFGSDERPRARRCVLDLEVAPDRHACVLSGRRTVPRGSPLNEIVNASVLTFEEQRKGGFGSFRIASWHRDSFEEQDLLVNVEAELAAVEVDGVLVTFNGRAFDLPILRQRQLRWWMCEAASVAVINDDPRAHVDVMLDLSLGGVGRWPSLSDACASVGFSLKGPSTAMRPDALPYETERCERDVVATAILYFHVLSAARRSVQPLLDGLPALGAFLASVGGGGHHLQRFARSALLSARAPWGASAPSGVAA